jgi:diguanylate cyclase (GGDEF)-like protein
LITNIIKRIRLALNAYVVGLNCLQQILSGDKANRLIPTLILSVSLAVSSRLATAQEAVTLQLKYLHQFEFAGYYAAKELGYYKEAGLDVTILEGVTGFEPEIQVVSGNAEYGVGNSSLLLSHYLGSPIVVIGVIFQHSPNVLLVPKAYGQNIQQLAGKRIMLSPQADDIVALLKKTKVNLDEMQVIRHSNDPDDLIQGRVEAYSASITNETGYLDMLNYEYHSYNPVTEGIDFYGDNLFTSQRELENHPQRVKAFRQASIKGWQYALNHPQEIADLIINNYSQRNSREHLLYEAQQMLPLIQPVLVEMGYMNPQRWRHIADIYTDMGKLAQNYSFESFLYDPNPRGKMLWWYIGLIGVISFLLISSSIYAIRLVNERKRSRDAITFKNILLSTQQEASVDGLIAVDINGKVISANSRFCDLWHLNFVVRENQHYANILTPIAEQLIDPHGFIEQVDLFFSQHELIKTDEIALKDGRIFEFYSAPMRSSGGEYFGRLWSFRDISQRKEAEELIWKQANFDFLTGLPNRLMLHDRLQEAIKKAQRNNQHVAVLFLDLDRFKEINDTLGHDMGDLLINNTALRLKESVRDSDTIARLGGDEFTIILGDLDDCNKVERIANQILKTISLPYHLHDEVVYISSSIGVTFYPQDGSDVEELLKNADQAMYAAKEKGRNRFEYFTQDMQEQAVIRRQLTNDLRVAQKEQQFELYYQPIIDLSTGEIHKAEALIRWFHPEKGFISPADFITIAEETGIIVDIGDWVFSEACERLKDWRSRLDPELQISINVSPVQFQSTTNSQLDWFAHMEDESLPGQALVVEITEGLLMDASERITDKLLAFRDAGVHVSLDDFGTGYSSLSYLKRFDIDYLKIDQAFVRNLEANSDDHALCEAIIVMAHKLGIKVIAEGVETEQQKTLLTEADCDFGQGYYFSRPLPKEQFEALISASVAK